MKTTNEIILAPSLLSADFANIEKAVRLVESTSSEWIHLDVMDGKFVPVITFGHKMVADIRKLTELVLDVHLMVDAPENFIDQFAAAGSDYITVHYEATVHLHRVIQQIKEKGVKAGVSIVPSTPVEMLKEILPFVDLVLVMTVNPGFGGQKMINECLRKVSELNRFRESSNLDFLISVDGGVGRQNAGIIRDAGVDVAVSGSSFFGAEDPAAEALVLKGIAE